MSLKSKLFATAAMPLLSATMVFTPVFAASQMQTFEVAQASQEEIDAEEAKRLLLLQQQKAEEDAAKAAAEQQAAEEAAKAAAEQQAADEAAKAAAEQQAADEAAKAAAEQQAADEAAKAAEQQAAEEAAKAAAEQQAADEAAKAAAEQQAADEAAKAAEQQAADEAAKAVAEQQAAEEAEQQRLLLEQQAAEDAAKKAAEEQQPAQATEQPAEEVVPETAEEPAPAQDQPVVTEEQTPVPDEKPETAEQPVEDPAAQEPVTAEQPVPEDQPVGEEQDAAGTPAEAEPVEDITETQSEEEKQQIAADPAQTDETIVLPVEDGAAVLDSDKEADNTGGQASREERRKLRETLRAEEENIAPPTSDAEAQVAEQIDAAVIQQAIQEEGQKLEAAPAFETPGVTNIENNTVNNTVTNNVTNNITNVVVEQQIDNRTVLRVDDRIVVRSDDRPRLRRDSEESFYEELPRDRVRETIVRPDGTRIVTIYDRYGSVVQRSRISSGGDEYLMVYASERESEDPAEFWNAGYDLPPMRLRIPVSDYIIDTSSDPDRDYYEFLSEPPVERVERVYSIDEVKYSARIRDKVRRIDLDTITFETGSAEVPLAQAKTLRKVANAIAAVLDKDPGETFLIEGHTDAVGGDQPNLILSDQRSEAVAELLTDVYGIPAENLVTQGYGERFLKVRTQAAEQQNRRVTIRRVTPLVRPVAQAN